MRPFEAHRSPLHGPGCVVQEFLRPALEDLGMLSHNPHEVDERVVAILAGYVRGPHVAGHVVGLAAAVAAAEAAYIASGTGRVERIHLELPKLGEDRMVVSQDTVEVS